MISYEEAPCTITAWAESWDTSISTIKMDMSEPKKNHQPVLLLKDPTPKVLSFWERVKTAFLIKDVFGLVILTIKLTRYLLMMPYVETKYRTVATTPIRFWACFIFLMILNYLTLGFIIVTCFKEENIASLKNDPYMFLGLCRAILFHLYLLIDSIHINCNVKKIVLLINALKVWDEEFPLDAKLLKRLIAMILVEIIIIGIGFGFFVMLSCIENVGSVLEVDFALIPSLLATVFCEGIQMNFIGFVTWINIYFDQIHQEIKKVLQVEDSVLIDIVPDRRLYPCDK